MSDIYEPLRAQLSPRALILLPEDQDFLKYSQLWSKSHHHIIPIVVALPAVTGDVSKIVNFCVENGIRMTVKAGGHSISGESVISDGMQICFDLMKGIHVDAKAKTARVEPGVKIEELDVACGFYGLACAQGTVGDTGVYGLSLHGGQGRMTSKYGFTVDHILECEIVLADGSVVVCNDENNTELFWAVRGTASSFGIVTSILFNLVEENLVYRGIVVLPVGPPSTIPFCKKVFSAYQDAPTSASFNLAISCTPHGSVAAFELYWFGNPEEGEAFFTNAGIKDFDGPVIAQDWHVAPYQIVNQGTAPPGTFDPANFYFKGGLKEELLESDLDLIFAEFDGIPPGQFVLFQFLGISKDRDQTKNSYPGRGVVSIEAGLKWAEGENAEGIAWARNLCSILNYTSSYYNFAEIDTDATSALDSLFGQNTKRLKELKKQYDPENVFKRRIQLI